MFQRFRRLRTTPALRALVRENHVRKEDLIYPLFVRPGSGIRNEVASMPGIFQLSIDEAIQEAKAAMDLGIKAVILFGIPETKDTVGSDALCDHGIIATAVRELKAALPELVVMTDLCFCEFTDHGHCGISDPITAVNNDKTLELLGQQALVHARAGADVIAPSGMMDGTISALREALDAEGYENLPLMAYSTKFASAWYGPFRDAAESAPGEGDRKSYQMDPANFNEAVRESVEDMHQGADILMVKPALSYLDVVRAIKEERAGFTGANGDDGELQTGGGGSDHHLPRQRGVPPVGRLKPLCN